MNLLTHIIMCSPPAMNLPAHDTVKHLLVQAQHHKHVKCKPREHTTLYAIAWRCLSAARQHSNTNCLYPLSLDGLPRVARHHTNSVNATGFWHSITSSNEPNHPHRIQNTNNMLIHIPKLNAHSTNHKNQAHIFLNKDSCIYTMPILGLI